MTNTLAAFNSRGPSPSYGKDPFSRDYSMSANGIGISSIGSPIQSAAKPNVMGFARLNSQATPGPGENGETATPSAADTATAIADEGTELTDAELDLEAEDEVQEEPVNSDGPSAQDVAKAAFLQTLQRAKEGDRKAFEEIFQLYHRRIYNAVYGMLGDPDDAQDVTQDVFMRLHDALPTLRADEAFSTYLYRIALNLCRDRALSWNSATGWPHPAFYDKSGIDWLRGFGGGLLVTCGLESFGGGNEDGIDTYGLHDRISYTPATRVKVEENWTEDGNYEIAIEGVLRQTRVFGTHLTLTRRIVARLGEDRLVVHDRLTNEGFSPAPAVILYHCNFGFPVVSEHSVVRAPSTERAPRDDNAAANPDTWNQFEAPQPDWPERCYNHVMNPDSDGFVRAEIWNEELTFGGYIRYRADELPHFTQWKSMSSGDYVCGLEPSSAYLTTRADLRERGELPLLQPGEIVEFVVELGAVLA